ncbi:hypothetical protein AAF712_014943 [Marasmius tenuissimus]|uniref:Uncharacterized protein n=1 Tax=Marasmius tenuissimus TaxID=585030 RepID=A0ABR2ZBU6_9AGAR
MSTASNPPPPDDAGSETDSDLEDPIPVKEFVLPALGALSDARARQIIADLQNNAEALRTQNDGLRLKVVELKAKIVVLRSRRGKRSKAKADEGMPFSGDAVKELGKKWAVMEGMWTSTSVFLKYPDDTMPHPQSPERFASVDAYNLGMVKQLHGFLSSNEARQLAAESIAFRDKFMQAGSSQKSTVLSNLRKVAGRIFEDANIPPALWENDSWSERGKNNIMRRLRSAPNGAPGQASSPFSSFLFPGGVYNMTLLFLSDYVWKAMRVTLFGPASLGENASVVRQNLVGNMWGVRKVTPAFIAFTAVMIQFMLNGDDTLGMKGGKSKIDYWDNYRSFHQLIEGSMTSSPSWTSNLFSHLNARVFKGTANHTAEQEETRVGAISQALVDLTLGSSPSVGPAPGEETSHPDPQPAPLTSPTVPLAPEPVTVDVEAAESPIGDEPDTLVHDHDASELAASEPAAAPKPAASSTRARARGGAGAGASGARRSTRNAPGTEANDNGEDEAALPTKTKRAARKK